MCIIAVSKKGVKQPTLDQLRNMYTNNPHGAGFMYARKGVVHIEKGFMTWDSFINAVKLHNFTAEDAVVYHFRISTQAGVKPTMTHPFPLTTNMEYCEKTRCSASVGVAHNGIIRMTSDAKETRFSDTVIFITSYMTRLVRKKQDLTDVAVLNMIEHLTNSKWALMDGDGEIVTVGHFETVKGVMFSNDGYKKYRYVWNDDDDGFTDLGTGSIWTYDKTLGKYIKKNRPTTPTVVTSSYVPLKYRLNNAEPVTAINDEFHAT